MHGTDTELLLRPDIVRMRGEMRVGMARVLPATRMLEGPDGRVTLEPRTLQMLIALADGGGDVVPRALIEARVWGVPVSEDTLNQAVASLRRAARVVGGFRVETIPRSGYRLVADEPAKLEEAPALPEVPALAIAEPSRRRLLIGGAIAAAAGTLGLAALWRPRPDPRVAELLAQGQQKLFYSAPETAREAAALFAEASELAPDDATVWGWRARAACIVADYAPPATVEADMSACLAVLAQAEALDRNDPNTVGARMSLDVDGRTLAEAEAIREAALARSPNSVEVISFLGAMAQTTGQTGRSWQMVSRAFALEPLMANFWWRRALMCWILGDWRRCDLIADEAIRRWPRHPMVWNARIATLAFSDRPEAALRLLGDPAIRAADLSPDLLHLWRTGLTALQSRAPADLATAQAAFAAAAPTSPGAAVQGILYLSALGDTALAHAIAEGLLFHRGPYAGPTQGSTVDKPFVGNIYWKMTHWLFTPATAAFRADPRFPAFARDLGLLDYWQARGVAPDPIHGVAADGTALATTGNDARSGSSGTYSLPA